MPNNADGDQGVTPKDAQAATPAGEGFTEGVIARETEDQLRYRKLKAEADKVDLELRELRRPYFVRNPQTTTALIATVGAIVGTVVLLQNNYFQNLSAANQFKEQEAKLIERDSRERIRLAEDQVRTATANAQRAVTALQATLKSKEQAIAAADEQLRTLTNRKSQL